MSLLNVLILVLSLKCKSKWYLEISALKRLENVFTLTEWFIKQTSGAFWRQEVAWILGCQNDINFRSRVFLFMKISKDELQVMTFYSSKIDGDPSGNELFKYKKPWFSVWNVCNVSEACSGWLNEQVSPVKRPMSRRWTESDWKEKCCVGFSSLFDLWLSKTMPKNISYEKKAFMNLIWHNIIIF